MNKSNTKGDYALNLGVLRPDFVTNGRGTPKTVDFPWSNTCQWTKDVPVRHEDSDLPENSDLIHDRYLFLGWDGVSSRVRVIPSVCPCTDWPYTQSTTVYTITPVFIWTHPSSIFGGPPGASLKCRFYRKHNLQCPTDPCSCRDLDSIPLWRTRFVSSFWSSVSTVPPSSVPTSHHGRCRSFGPRQPRRTTRKERGNGGKRRVSPDLGRSYGRRSNGEIDY